MCAALESLELSACGADFFSLLAKHRDPFISVTHFKFDSKTIVSEGDARVVLEIFPALETVDLVLSFHQPTTVLRVLPPALASRLRELCIIAIPDSDALVPFTKDALLPCVALKSLEISVWNFAPVVDVLANLPFPLESVTRFCLKWRQADVAFGVAHARTVLWAFPRLCALRFVSRPGRTTSAARKLLTSSVVKVRIKKQ